ncbi:MAG: MBL fold metallo-hydrolase, partial [Planctomycetota bacterium]
MTDVRYVNKPRTFLVRNSGGSPDDSGSAQLLLGSRLHVQMPADANGFVSASTVPDEAGNFKTGFVDITRISDRQQLKIFYLDVGQGDATLIEAEDAIIIIDGGPNKGFHDELKKRLKRLRSADEAAGLPQRDTLKVNAMIVTHFDLDHYFGLKKVLEDDDFEVGKIYHNGLPRYGDGADKDINLGSVTEHADGTRSISTDLRDLDSARDLLAGSELDTDNGNPNKFAQFLKAAVDAHDGGRLGSMELLVRRDTSGTPETLPNTGPDITLEVLGPVTTKETGPIRLRAFPDPHKVTATNPHPSPSESHTINGNSVVLRLTYGTRTFLFGGDLNQPAQKYLKERYPSLAPFSANVNKACHHGSSDFELEYLKAVAPDATVFSSGDNGSHDHPLPDAMGAAAKHSEGEFPLVFSTELARETSSSSIKLGHINARSNGDIIVMAQKKEKPSLKKTWHSF